MPPSLIRFDRTFCLCSQYASLLTLTIFLAFPQFVGGDTAEDALPLIEELRTQNTGCLFAYSVEVDEAQALGDSRDETQSQLPATSFHKQIVRETLHCVDVAADYEDKHTTSLSGRRTWVAIKLASTYARISL